MGKQVYLACMGLVLSGASSALGQRPSDIPHCLAPAPATDKEAPTATAACEQTQVFFATPAAPQPIVWGEVEYLLWWLSAGSTPPLVSTGDPAAAIPGALGQPGTAILFGGPNALDYGAFSGLRATVGTWLGPEALWGVELSGFLLERRSRGFASTSDALGNPPTYIPFQNFNPKTPPTPHEGSFTVSDPLLLGGVTGNVAVTASSQFWGAEANGLCGGFGNSRLNLAWLLGFRYLGLDEDLNLSGSHNAFLFDIRQSWQERFATQNNFYGGQLGARAWYTAGSLSLDLAVKVALGATHQVVTVSGSSTESGAGSINPGNFPGGAVFALPSNLGQQSHDTFAVVPQVQVKVGYNVTRFCRAFVGYDFLYWSSVVRAGDQIDRQVNDSQAIGGTLVGDALPSPQFNRTGFFAHGLTFGLGFQY